MQHQQPIPKADFIQDLMQILQEKQLDEFDDVILKVKRLLE